MPEPSRRAARKLLPRAVLALGVTSLLGDVGSEMIFPLLPAFMASLGATPAFLGLVEGAADATSSLVKLAAGYVSDRSGRRKPLVVSGYAVAALARPLVAFATAPWHVLAIRITDRIGKGARTAPRDALIAAVVGTEDSGHAFGFHRAMDHAGAVIGPLVASLLLALGVPLRTVFAIAVIPGLLSVLAVATVKEPPVEAPPRDVPPEDGHRLPGALRSYLGILLLFSLCNSSDAFLLLRAKDLGVPMAQLPLLWTVFHVAKVVSSYLGGGWSDRVARTQVVILGWIIYSITYVLFGVASEVWQVWALFVFYGTHYGLTEPAEKALIRDLAPTAVRGRAYGYYSFIVGLSAIPAGLLTGFLWQTWSPRASLNVGAAIGAVSSVALAVWAARTGGGKPANGRTAAAS